MRDMAKTKVLAKFGVNFFQESKVFLNSDNLNKTVWEQNDNQRNRDLPILMSNSFLIISPMDAPMFLEPIFFCQSMEGLFS